MAANAKDLSELAGAVEKLAENAKSLRTKSSGLNTRIAVFEEWISKLPGRVTTSIWWPASGIETYAERNPEEDETPYYGLRLAREGKEWRIEWSLEPYNTPYDELNWLRPVDADLDTKVLIVKKLPELVESMVKSQATLQEKLDDATKTFDTFAAKVGLEFPEGA